MDVEKLKKLILCNEVATNLNELLRRENIKMDNYNEKSEKNLLEITKQKEENDKRLLNMEILIGVLGVLPLLISTAIVSCVPMAEWISSLIVLTSLIPLLIAVPFAIRIEQTAGYYTCRKCHHKYVPTYSSVLWAMHVGRTRHMKCPKCNKWSWNKKVISKD